MLSKLLRFLILPILLITLLVYASIPWWVPVVAKYSQLYTDLDIKHLEIGYPWHDHWQIQHLQGHQGGWRGPQVEQLMHFRDVCRICPIHCQEHFWQSLRIAEQGPA